MTTGPVSTHRAIRRLTALSLGGAILLVGVVGGLAGNIKLNGAVITSGNLTVDSYVKSVQHQRGGTVSQLHVHNGDRVKVGDILIRLDDTQTKANLAIISLRLRQLAMRSARLAAERDGKDSFERPVKIGPTQIDADTAELDAIEQSERRLFEDRRSSMEGRISQLRERIRQLDQEAKGLVSQEDGKKRAVEIINRELASLQPLLDQGVIPATRVYSLQRDAANLAGDIGSLEASAAELRGKIAETELQIIQVGDDHRSEVSDQLRQAENDLGEYAERLVAAQDELAHVDIRAPQDGIVHELNVHAAGAVVAPGQTIMQIVPDEDNLIPELKIAPHDIDQVRINGPVGLRFSAFSYRTTPELTGQVVSIAPDLTVDQHTGQTYYTVRVSVPQSEWHRLGDLKVAAGMPVEAFIKTGERTALAYLAQPFTDQINRAFREE
ncbi:HlyD family type I secretion periplasmic adaptor subunit [Oryzifoliimicrobium ureilyticus]|uniref:HlyD family type I secretion periplasmic adaptor subunit n=1 Tax=Oryzifoliimicrobium ureilyticus TaxID=3113724 RepID=UPI00307628A8